MSHSRPWLRAIIWIALAKVVSAIVLYLVAVLTATGDLTPRGLLMAAHVVAFGAAAGLLLAGAARDPRAELLGGVLLLTAAVFADNAPRQVLSAWPVWQSLVSALYLIQVDAFSAWFLWLFVAEFPRVPGLGPLWALPRRAASVSFWIGLTLLIVNLAHAALTASGSLTELTTLWRPLVRSERSGAWLYWLVQYALLLPALPILIGRARAAAVPERRRVSLLLAGIVLGAAPTIVWILLSIIWPGFSRVVPLRAAGWVIYPTLLAAPFIVAYAVLVRHALDTRLIVRRALQYAFARYTIAALAVIPLVVLAFSLYRRRNESVAQVVSGTNSAVLLLLGGAAIVAWRGRRHVIDRLDRRYFREQYDSREILRALVEQCRKARNRPELAESLRVEIDRALHLDTLRVLYVEPTQRQFSSPMGDVRPLQPSAAFLAWLTAAEGAVDVDLEQPSHSVNNLPEADRHWLADAGARLVLPLKDAERRVVGFVSLGDKRSELPFSSEDRLLLSTVAAAASLSLAFLSVHPPEGVADSSGDRHSMQTEQAMECSQCGAVHRAGVSPCPRCGGPTAPSLVPRVLAGKFRFLERVGEGGMGVVYRGVDLGLNRAVAIKTLPHVSPEQAVRLRREARAMAAVAHPNLAMIFGSETWNGLPVLIVEYLPGGTLAARLTDGPRPVAEVIDLGVTLAEVTSALHRAGILHSDIKPSNIGFTADGTLKLLDFGMARLLEGATTWDRRRTEERQGVSTASGRRRTAELAIDDPTTDGRIAGTLPYLSPEAVAGVAPDPTFDVWSICVVLFEAIAGTNPAQAGTPLHTLQRITTGAFPDLRELRPDVDAAVATFFQRAFSLDANQRPRSASALRDDLLFLRTPRSEAGAGGDA